MVGTQKTKPTKHRWGRGPFQKLGYAGLGLVAGSSIMCGITSPVTLAVALPVAAYWFVGARDMKQPHHALKRNFPVLANMRYFLEVRARRRAGCGCCVVLCLLCVRGTVS